YGPTEAAVEVTAFACRPGSTPPSVSIGRAISNIVVHVVDPGLELMPFGIPGELCLGGVGLARGYLGRPDLTAEKFVPHPWSLHPGERLYRTGDLVRRRADGNIDFLGRLDHQVKVRGVRIELGEVEAALAAHPAVQGAAVVVGEDEGRRLLAACLVAKGGWVESELREFLARLLPEAMIPALFLPLAQLPLLPNGKLDRRSLAGTARAHLRSQRSEPAVRTAPRNDAERLLAEIWCEVLQVPEVGIHDNFFTLGGDSILSIQVSSKARHAGLHLLPRQLFESPTVAQLAAGASAVGATTVEQGPVSGPVPLTPIQSWFFGRRLANSHHFNQAVLLASEGRLVPEALVRSLAHLQAHHDALRLCFTPAASGTAETGEGSRWTQTNAAEMPLPFAHIALSAVPLGQRQAVLEAACAALQGSLDLAGPLWRAVLFSGMEGEGGDRVLLVLHHLVVDGVSWRILLDDLAAVYRQAEGGRELSMPAKTASYRSWAEALVAAAERGAGEDQIAWWREAITPAVVSLPLDWTTGANSEGAARTVVVELEPDETRLLLDWTAKARQASIDDLLLAALAKTLAEWTGSARVLLDMERHGRDELLSPLDVSRTVGWFTALFPVPLDLSGAQAPGDVLTLVRDQLRRIPQGGVGYSLLRHLGSGEVRGILESLPQAEVLYNYLGQLDPILSQRGGLRPANEWAGPPRARAQARAYLFEINGGVSNGSLTLGWTYSENRHHRATVERLAARFLAVIRELGLHGLASSASGHTPADFPLVRLSQAALDHIALAATADGGVADLYPASPLQQGMLFHSLQAPGSGVYVQQIQMTLQGELDLPLLERAWQSAGERHAVLRTAFAWRALDRPLQRVVPGTPIVVDHRDWQALGAEEQQDRLAELLAEDRQTGFDLSSAPLHRLVLVTMGKGRQRLIWTHHHAILDGWSLPILFGEVFGSYAAARRGELPRQPETRLDFRDYIAWLEGQDQQAAESFWRRELAGFTSPTALDVGRIASG
ncbi:MAG TPA: condensation domain-containing protein, partial [Thermoanaerobaculia bacterium]|nr:condensation domain-containing protein [Thermoanaerobaculia bacterium]